MVWQLNYGLIMNKTSIPLIFYKFLLLTFSNFDYGRNLTLTMDIDEAWFGN
jgi:hypothetical protein